MNESWSDWRRRLAPGPEGVGEFTRSFLVSAILLVSGLFLLNLGGGGILKHSGAGWLGEFVADTTPWSGNLDELVAALLLLSALRYFGLDVTAWFFPPPRPWRDRDDLR